MAEVQSAVQGIVCENRKVTSRSELPFTDPGRLLARVVPILRCLFHKPSFTLQIVCTTKHDARRKLVHANSMPS